MAVTSEGAALIVALLTAEARYLALVNVVTGLRVIEELVARLACALGAKRALDAAVTAAAIGHRTVIRA